MKTFKLNSDDHNHSITEEAWKASRKQRTLTEVDKKKIAEYAEVQGDVTAIADQLNRETGRQIKKKQVRTFIQTLKPGENEMLSALDHALNACENNGGCVKLTFVDVPDGPKEIRTLFIGTKKMIDDYNFAKPNLMLLDTTFKTNIRLGFAKL